MTLATLAHPSRHSRGIARLALALVGALGLAAVLTISQGSLASTAHAAPGLRYQRGYSIQQGWLCYGWSNGTLHCTQRWHRSGGALVSDNPGWVPSNAPSAARPRSVAAPAQRSVSSGAVRGVSSAGEPCRSTQYFNGPIYNWWQTPPSCYSHAYAINPANYVYRPYFGECNWWPEVMNPSRPDLLWGPYRHGTVPVPGATVHFAPGVQGAGSTGHWARVVAVQGQWMLVSEMNFYYNGGGFGRVEYRYAHTGPGVTFIY